MPKKACSRVAVGKLYSAHLFCSCWIWSRVFKRCLAFFWNRFLSVLFDRDSFNAGIYLSLALSFPSVMQEVINAQVGMQDGMLFESKLLCRWSKLLVMGDCSSKVVNIFYDRHTRVCPGTIPEGDGDR